MCQWVKMLIMQFSWNSKAQSFGHNRQQQCQKIVQHKRDLKCHRKSLPSKLVLPMNRPFLVWTDETLCPVCAVCAQRRHPAASCGSLQSHPTRMKAGLSWNGLKLVKESLKTTTAEHNSRFLLSRWGAEWRKVAPQAVHHHHHYLIQDALLRQWYEVQLLLQWLQFWQWGVRF